MFRYIRLNLTDCCIIAHAQLLTRQMLQPHFGSRQCGAKSATSGQAGKEQALQPAGHGSRSTPIHASLAYLIPTSPTSSPEFLQPQYSFLLVISFASTIYRINVSNSFPLFSIKPLPSVYTVGVQPPPISRLPIHHPILKPNTSTPYTSETTPVANLLHTRHTSLSGL
jgi:hypothetical protein